jgi:hypothetical protein
MAANPGGARGARPLLFVKKSLKLTVPVNFNMNAQYRLEPIMSKLTLGF